MTDRFNEIMNKHTFDILLFGRIMFSSDEDKELKDEMNKWIESPEGQKLIEKHKSYDRIFKMHRKIYEKGQLPDKS